MIPKTLVGALTALALIAASDASPCKLSTSTSVAISSTSISATALTSSETVSASVVSTDTATTEEETSTETSTASGTTITLEEIPTVSTSTGSVTSDTATGTATTTGTTTEEVPQSTDTTTTSPDTTTLLTTTAPTTTADSTTTAQTTTTTSLPPNTDPENWSFDVQPQSLNPWQIHDTENEATLALDTTIVHSGLRSARFYSGPTWNWKTITRPLDKTKITADIPFTISAWFRTDAYYGGNPNSGTPGCASAGLYCYWSSIPGNPPQMSSASPMVGQWQKVTSTCTFTQAQLNAANPPILHVGGACAKATLWIDEVVVNYVQVA